MLHFLLLTWPSIITVLLSTISTTTPILLLSLPAVFTTNWPTSNGTPVTLCFSIIFCLVLGEDKTPPYGLEGLLFDFGSLFRSGEISLGTPDNGFLVMGSIA